MNKDETNFTPDQLRQIEIKTREKEREQDINEELIKKRDKIKGEDHKNQKEILEGDIKNLREKIRTARERNEQIEREITQATKLKHDPSAGDPYDLYRINLPGGDVQVIHHYQLSNFNNQVLTYFSYLDCPFKDEGTGGHTKAQKLELMRSITGLNNPPITSDDVIKNNENNTDKEWEYKEPGTVAGITEPEHGSYE